MQQSLATGLSEERHVANPPTMNDASDRRLDDTIIEATSLNGLKAAKRSSCSLALYPREMSPDLPAWLDGLPDEDLPNGRVLVRVGDAPAALAEIFGTSSRPKDDLLRELYDDMIELIDLFSSVADSPEVDVRVERIRHDACKKFHRDHVRMRLICCYRGPTTVWVPASHADEALDRQQDYQGPLQHFPRFAVSIFKGHQQGVVHRSPQIVGSGETRLLLCLNERSAASPPLWHPL